MTLGTTAIYASILTLLVIYLGARVSIQRAKSGIAILSGDDKTLAERMRQHGNLAENLALALLLMAMVEMNGASATWMHAIGGLLLAGRIIHPFGINFDNPSEIARGLGSTLTNLSMLVAVVYLVWSYVI